MLHTAKYMHQILSLSNDAYEEIFREIDTSNLVKKKRNYLCLDKQKFKN